MNAMVKARVEPDLKMQSESVLRQMGLDMSGAIKMFLTQVVMRQALPFDVRIVQPNQTTLRAIEDSYAGRVEQADSVDVLFDEANRG